VLLYDLQYFFASPRQRLRTVGFRRCRCVGDA